MTEICIWLKKVLEWVDRCGPPAIPYIGKAPYGYRNLPAPHLELLYVLDKGVKYLSIGNRVVKIPPFHVAIHNVHQGNFTPTIQRFASWCVFLDVEGDKTFANLCDEPLFCCAPLPSNAEVYAAYERLGGLCVRHGTGPLAYDAPGAAYDPVCGARTNPLGAVRIKAALLDLLAILLSALIPDKSAPTHPTPIQRAIEYMSLHYREPETQLADISQAAGLSVHHFGRLFREYMGETPMHHLRLIRAHQARYLLEHTQLRVDEIAFDVGFSDPFHFSRVFRSITGISPRRWRERKA